MVWSFGAGQREASLVAFLDMTTCTTTITTLLYMIHTEFLYCLAEQCTWR